jgi:uncharacterized membrane protein YuzA (DUF378 family)
MADREHAGTGDVEQAEAPLAMSRRSAYRAAAAGQIRMIGALAWGYFVTDVNILDRLLEKIADPADAIAFVLIGAAGVYAVVRVLATRRS